MRFGQLYGEVLLWAERLIEARTTVQVYVDAAKEGAR
jgi:hypothetical protein